MSLGPFLAAQDALLGQKGVSLLWRMTFPSSYTRHTESEVIPSKIQVSRCRWDVPVGGTIGETSG